MTDVKSEDAFYTVSFKKLPSLLTGLFLSKYKFCRSCSRSLVAGRPASIGLAVSAVLPASLLIDDQQPASKQKPDQVPIFFISF